MSEPGVRDLRPSSVSQHVVLHALHTGVLSHFGAIGRLIVLHLCRHKPGSSGYDAEQHNDAPHEVSRCLLNILAPGLSPSTIQLPPNADGWMFLREDCCCPGTRVSLKTTRFVLTSDYSRNPRHQNHNLHERERERERALELWGMKNKVLGSGPDVMKLNSQQLHSVSRRLSGSHRCCEMRHYFLQSYLRDWLWARASYPSWQNQPPSLCVDSSLSIFCSSGPAVLLHTCSSELKMVQQQS